MTTYTVDQEASAKQPMLIKRVLTIALTILAIFFLAMVIIFLRVNDKRMALFMGLILLYMPIGLFLGNKQMARMLETYRTTEIELGDDHLVLRQNHKPNIRIQREEVKKLTEDENGLTVYGANSFHSIAVPYYLIGFEEVKAKLSAWVPIQTQSARDYLKVLPLMLVPSLGGIICVVLFIITRSTWSFVLFCILYMGNSVYAAWFHWQRVDLTPREKRGKMIYYGATLIAFGFLLTLILTR